nr:T-cell receptor delta chain variable region {NuVD4.4, VDJ junction} [nude mice, bone marrow, Peptide Partial, 16 aa] [Mus musculus]
LMESIRVLPPIRAPDK